MSVNDIPSGTLVGIDANVFIRHFTLGSAESTLLLKRVEAGEIVGVTTTPTLHEVLHRLMVFEARESGAISGNNPALRLRRKQKVVRKLNRYHADTAAILGMGVRLLPPLADTLHASHRFRTEYGLLVNDSLLAATLVANGVGVLVTADRDFLRVKELDVYLLG